MRANDDKRTSGTTRQSQKRSSAVGGSRLERPSDDATEQHPGLENPLHDQDQNAAGQPIGDADLPPTGKQPKRPQSRTPARGSGVPPTTGLGDEDIESEIEPIDEESGRVNSGRPDSIKKLSPNPGKTEDF